MFKQRVIAAAIAAGLLTSTTASSEYNANMTGVVQDVLTYTDGDWVLFRLVNQPASHPTCNPAYFVLNELIPAARLDRLVARLLAAKATGESVNIGYDAAGDCANGYIRAHRVG